MGRARIAALLCAVLATIALYKASIISDKKIAEEHASNSIASVDANRAP